VNDAKGYLEGQKIVVKTFTPGAKAKTDWDTVLASYRAQHKAQNPSISDEELEKILLPYDLVKGTQSYKENKEWVESLKKDGYSVLDLGNPTKADPSAFYDLEKEVLF
jgi:hypothetical protein